jgi:1-aminocyclopropane-1-carboxylate deaminase
MKPELLEFINRFQERTEIPIDPIYTSKMMFGIYEMIREGRFEKGTTILVIHTGGLQGWQGMKHRGLI